MSAHDDAAGAVSALADARPLLVLLDIDGTLAPIAPRPEDARVPAETLAVLTALAARAHTHVAFVTGRGPADARRMVPVPGTWIIGNHGVETLTPEGAHQVDPRVTAHEQALRGAAAELTRVADAVPGARLEDKGWSISLHYRQAARADVPAVVAAAHAAAERAGLRANDGKEVVELKAPVAVDKGTAALALADALSAAGGAVLAAGDDTTDENMFRHVRAALPRTVTIRIAPADGPTAAEYRVDDPAALRAVLAPLAPLVPPPEPPVRRPA